MCVSGCFRAYIKQCVGANDDDVLLFTGSGVTGAIHKLISAMMIVPEKTVSHYKINTKSYGHVTFTVSSALCFCDG